MGNENSTKNGASANEQGSQGPNGNDRASSYRTNEENEGGEVIADPKNIAALQDSTISPAPQKKLTKEDFTLIKTIGKGSFGKVLMVRKNDTGKVYAMKVLSKEKVIARKQYEHTLSERKILQDISHPFLVGMHFAFQSTSKL